jgi:outer membrane protein OmpA-like peptidoglycan-associated protein
MALNETCSGLADYNLELSEKEAEALRKVLKNADGRKSEVKLAKDALGVK